METLPLSSYLVSLGEAADGVRSWLQFDRRPLAQLPEGRVNAVCDALHSLRTSPGSALLGPGMRDLLVDEFATAEMPSTQSSLLEQYERLGVLPDDAELSLVERDFKALVKAAKASEVVSLSQGRIEHLSSVLELLTAIASEQTGEALLPRR